MTNMFKNAYFGKAYKTRDGRKLLYIHSSKEKITKRIFHKLLLENNGFLERVYDNNGICLSSNHHCSRFDIISEWVDEIDEEELDKLAEAYAEEFELPSDVKYACKKDFKAGYRSKGGINYV